MKILRLIEFIISSGILVRGHCKRKKMGDIVMHSCRVHTSTLAPTKQVFAPPGIGHLWSSYAQNLQTPTNCTSF